MPNSCSLPSTNAIQIYRTDGVPLTLQHLMQLEYLGGKYLHMKRCYQKAKNLLGEIPTYTTHIYMHNIFW